MPSTHDSFTLASRTSILRAVGSTCIGSLATVLAVAPHSTAVGAVMPMLARPQDSAPAQPAPTATPPSQGVPAEASDDILRGPKVPDLDVKSDRPYVEGTKQGERLSKPVLEQRVYFRTIDLMEFDGPVKEEIEALKVAFVERVAEYQKVAQKRRSELEAKRKGANPAEPPSEEFKREMNAIEAARPKLTDLQTKVNEVIGADRARELEKKYLEELKRVRAELTRQTEEERKRKRAEIEEQKKAKAAEGGASPGGGKSGDASSGGSDDGGNMTPRQ